MLEGVKMSEYSNYLEFAKDIAVEAGKIMKKYFEQDNGSSYKGDRTIVTLADKEINSYLIKRVKEQYPNHSVLGEEESFDKSSNYVWVCDPVDGTAMYARHIPIAVFSLALVIDGVSVVGVVYDPFTDSLYSAIKGNGAYRNGEKITVNDFALDDVRSVSHFDIWQTVPYPDVWEVYKELGKKTYFVSLGTIIRASMCVATGDFVLAIFPATIGKNYDIAAVKVIVEEAGGKVTNFWGEDQRYDKDIDGAVISNGVVHDEVLSSIKKYLERK